jgi:thioredoxin reductase
LSVIVCSGVENIRTIEGEEEFFGRGVSYCATCDGFLYKGKTIAVFCTSKRLEHEIEYLSDFAEKVYLITMYKKAEIERIQKYRDALDTFLNDYLKNGVVEFTELTLKDMKGNPFTAEEQGFARTGTYAVNLCPNDEETTMKNLKEYLSYNVPSQTDSTKQTQTAKDMLVMFFDFDGVEESYQYESLIFVNQLIAKGKN